MMKKVAIKADTRKKRSLNKNQWTMKTMLMEVRIIRMRVQRRDEHDVIPGFLTAGTLFLRALTGMELSWNGCPGTSKPFFADFRRVTMNFILER